jgi:DNA polymerase III alpha subunit (gram-positive type)
VWVERIPLKRAQLALAMSARAFNALRKWVDRKILSAYNIAFKLNFTKDLLRSVHRGWQASGNIIQC